MIKSKELVHIQCPVCKQQTDVSIPRKIVSLKKFGSTKIKICDGICCDHEFIVFLNINMNVIGTESVDVVFNWEKKDREEEEFKLNDLIALYGYETVSHFIRAFLFGIPIVFVERLDFTVNIHSLNSLFSNLVPKRFKVPLIVSSLRDDEINDDILKDFVLYDLLKSKINLPWKKKKKILKFEENLIKKSLDILEYKNQTIVIQEELGQLLDKAEFICKHLEKSKSYRVDIMKVEFTKKFGKPWTPGEYELLLEVSKKKFGARVDLLVVDPYLHLR